MWRAKSVIVFGCMDVNEIQIGEYNTQKTKQSKKPFWLTGCVSDPLQSGSQVSWVDFCKPWRTFYLTDNRMTEHSDRLIYWRYLFMSLCILCTLCWKRTELLPSIFRLFLICELSHYWAWIWPERTIILARFYLSP